MNRITGRVLLLILSFIAADLALAKSIASDPKLKIDPARVWSIHHLVKESDKVRIAFVVEDTGGSTDFSPTQKLYFTLYQKGEMFSTDATFPLGYIFSLKGVQRLGPGTYAANAEVFDPEKNIRSAVITVKAGKAIVAMKAVRCPDDFDCKASENFQSVIEVQTK